MAEGTADAQEVIVKIKSTSGGEVAPVVTRSSTTIQELKEEISKQNDVPSDQIRLIYKGAFLHFWSILPHMSLFTLTLNDHSYMQDKF